LVVQGFRRQGIVERIKQGKDGATLLLRKQRQIGFEALQGSADASWAITPEISGANLPLKLTLAYCPTAQKAAQ
jgi:hypothetical protein